MNIKYNIFNYATKELSHDAFLAYLFVNYKENFNVFRHITNIFLGNDSIVDINDINDVQVIKQYENIDLLIELDIANDEKQLIVIENKTKSEEHDSQLSRYFNKLKNSKNEYLNYKKTFVYYKLDFLNEDINNDSGEWKEFYIEDIIEIVTEWEKMKPNNLIINQYIEYVKYIEKSIIKRPEKLSEWNYFSFKSFMKTFIEEKNIKNATVNTFRGKWMSFNVDKYVDSEVYFEYALDLNLQKQKTEIIATKAGYSKKFNEFCKKVKTKRFTKFEVRSKYLPIKESTKNPYLARCEQNVQTEAELICLLTELYNEYKKL